MPDKAFRSALYTPASNGRALEKTKTLDADIIIVDLEDAVSPSEKSAARQTLHHHFQSLDPDKPKPVIRINAMSTAWFEDDLALCVALAPSAVLLPKVNSVEDIQKFSALLEIKECPSHVKIWAMVETPRSILNISSIADHGLDETSRLEALVVGTNDLSKETGVALTPMREHMHPWLMQIIVAARAGKLMVLDGVSNDFNDKDAFAAQCRQSVAMGFDGRSLIHPAQIEIANHIFSPSQEQIDEAKEIVYAFEKPENRDKGVLSVNGRMVERLHRDMAIRLLARTH